MRIPAVCQIQMNIDVDAANFSYNGKQEIQYTNNSPDELSVYFHLYWNAFKPGSMMDQRGKNQGKNADGRLAENRFLDFLPSQKMKKEAKKLIGLNKR